MRRNFLKMIGLGSVAAALSGCWGNSYTWNQKLTVKVQTPDGVKSGSAVTRVTASVGKHFISGDSRVLTFGVGGEATIVDLGHGKYLFAALASSGPSATEYLAELTFADVIHVDPSKEQIARLNDLYQAVTTVQGSHPVPTKNYPLLVNFTDINGPKTVKEVKPGQMSEAFGTGYSLKSITLEITTEPVTRGAIQKIAHWVEQENPIFVNWQSFPAGHPLRSLNKTSFAR
jgi:hypothetical protein